MLYSRNMFPYGGGGGGGGAKILQLKIVHVRNPLVTYFPQILGVSSPLSLTPPLPMPLLYMYQG